MGSGQLRIHLHLHIHSRTLELLDIYLEPPKRSSDILDKNYSRIWEILEVLEIYLEPPKGLFDIWEL